MIAYSKIVEELINFSSSFEGEKEIRPNRSPKIDIIQRYFGTLGVPYCVYFILYVWKQTLNKFNLVDPFPPTGNSQTLFSHMQKRNVTYRDPKEIKPGDIIIYRKGTTLSGHAGLIISRVSENSILTIEGNTKREKVEGSEREGDGIYKRIRFIGPSQFSMSSFYIRGFIDCKKLIISKNRGIISDDTIPTSLLLPVTDIRPPEKPRFFFVKQFFIK